MSKSFHVLVRAFPGRLLIALALASAAACGGGDPSMSGADGGGSVDQEPCPAGFLPLKVGTIWKYDVRDVSSMVATTKETVVEGLVEVPMVPGTMAYRIRTKKGISLRDETVSWQNRIGQTVLRYQEIAYQPAVAGAAPVEEIVEWWRPAKLRLDESPAHMRKGASWTLDYMETSIEMGVRTERMRSERWNVVGVNEEVQVRKGTYKTLHVQRLGAESASSGSAGSDKHYWFACGVGKVKETGGQTEDLTDFIPGQ